MPRPRRRKVANRPSSESQLRMEIWILNLDPSTLFLMTISIKISSSTWVSIFNMLDWKKDKEKLRLLFPVRNHSGRNGRAFSQSFGRWEKFSNASTNHLCGGRKLLQICQRWVVICVVCRPNFSLKRLRNMKYTKCLIVWFEVIGGLSYLTSKVEIDNHFLSCIILLLCSGNFSCLQLQQFRNYIKQ